MRLAALALIALLPSPALAAGPSRGVSPRPVHRAALLGGDRGAPSPGAPVARLEEMDRQRTCLLLEASVQPRAEFAPLEDRGAALLAAAVRPADPGDAASGLAARGRPEEGSGPAVQGTRGDRGEAWDRVDSARTPPTR